MKLGNISQTVVPVPNFFMDQKHRPLETFNLFNKTDSNFYKKKNKSRFKLNPISIPNNNTQSEFDEISKTSRPFSLFSFKRQNSNSYFRDRDVLTTFYNLNINNNPRNFSRKWIELNKEKYMPLYNQNKYPDLTEMKKTYFPDIIDINNTKKNNRHEYKKIMSVKSLNNFYDYKNYRQRENLEEFLEPNLREDIKNNTKNLIDRINMNYDIKKWSDFDSRTTFNRFFQTAYSPLNNVIKNSESLKNEFGNALKQKALSLKNINEQTKKIISKTMDSNDNNNDEINSNNNNENITDALIDNCTSNLIKLKYNNREGPDYNSKDKKFIDNNKYITRLLNKTKLYKDFPSKTREEFNEKKNIIPNHLLKNNKYQGNVILRDKFGNDDENNDKLIQEDYLQKMWKRPLHDDAYKLHE